MIPISVWNWFACFWTWVNDWHDVLITVFTCLIFIVTTALAIYTAALWRSTKKLVESGDVTSKRELRAYVGVTETEVIHTIMDDELLARVSFQNTGQTPAHDLTSWICEDVFVKKNPNECLFANGDDQEKGGVLVPGVTWTRHISIKLHNLNMDNLERQTDAIWIWGGIDYKDSFGEMCTVTFRFWVGEKRQRLDPLGRPMDWWPLIPHKDGNKATYGDKTPS
jgi:hypothetical protein